MVFSYSDFHLRRFVCAMELHGTWKQLRVCLLSHPCGEFNQFGVTFQISRRFMAGRTYAGTARSMASPNIRPVNPAGPVQSATRQTSHPPKRRLVRVSRFSSCPARSRSYCGVFWRSSRAQSRRFAASLRRPDSWRIRACFSKSSAISFVSGLNAFLGGFSVSIHSAMTGPPAGAEDCACLTLRRIMCLPSRFSLLVLLYN